MKLDQIDDFIKTHETSNIPFVIFDNQKKIYYANKSFIKKFNLRKKSYKNKILDFLILKEPDQKIPFSSLELDDILKDMQIFSYYSNINKEDFFFVTTFPLINNKEVNYYYSILNEIKEIEERIIDKSIQSLIAASQLKDNDTGNHIKRINAYVYEFSKYIFNNYQEKYPEIDEFFIEKIFKVASLHDIGKIGTPDYILTKPGPLTANEFKIMQEHTINGAFILSEMAGQMARDIALFHHEKWDGTGYPYKLKGELIPLSARIVAIADVYDALRMKRPYKPFLSHTETRKKILDSNGSHFDPLLTDCFNEINERFETIFDRMIDGNEM